jgi:hypothetical protein
VARTEEGWLPFREIRERFSFRQNYLYVWHEQGCPYLGGAKLAARRIPTDIGGRVRSVWCYSRGQLEEIARGIQASETGEYRDERGVWLSAGEAHKRYGLWDASLERWRKGGCLFLDGKPLRGKRVLRLTASRERRRRWVYYEADLERIAAGQKGPREAVYRDDEGMWLFACEVERRFGLQADNLWHYRNKEYPFLPKHRLRAKQVPGWCHPAHRTVNRLRWVYSEQDLQLIDARRRGLPDPVPQPPHRAAPPSPVPAAAAPRPKRRGRPRGMTPEVKKKIAGMLSAWERRELGDNKAAYGRKFGFDKSDATRLINAHERAKRHGGK